MKKYKKIKSNINYKDIGNFLKKLTQSARIRELKFCRLDEKTYDIYSLKLGHEKPRIDGYEFIDSIEKEEIGHYIESYLNKEYHYRPKRIRIIHPQYQMFNFGIFFKS